ncbi:hypothetical protein [Candidatus Cyanaurora vandensis]|uniref:hypothetical protein n=1 Tax=Candidatus Cyanaurora vandensis TaxID=2714958 RepID=UPI00258000DC|nr:hypothetical protein [Candidatus Cyanaurora vandensis]
MSSFDAQEPSSSLHRKLDQLQRALDGLPDQLTARLQDQVIKPHRPSLNTVMTASKDILEEEPPVYTFGVNGRPLSPEAQIQRLTAQLTAAYNRIAALEEQLLNKRNLV